VEAAFIGAAESSQLTTLPSFDRSIRPAFSRTRRCFMKPGSDMPEGAASSLTARLPPASESSTPRRVGSASAENTRSSTGSSYLTIWFSIRPFGDLVKRNSLREGGVCAAQHLRDLRRGSPVSIQYFSLRCDSGSTFG